MKNETESSLDELAQRISELAAQMKKLTREAERKYSVEVENTLRTNNRDSWRIERCLDGMLDFSFDDRMLLLYKRLCRHYFDIDPRATASYIDAYREMWDEESLAGGVKSDA
ncbi:MAG TPA: hypothetical protein PKM59_03000 [Thermodesulfobacteriota bacterium]|nr:hypothetical protein [Thermodesulfobacteriota bacterium]